MVGGRQAPCQRSGCSAAAVEGAGGCWGHAADDDLGPALRRLAEDGTLVGRDVRFTADRLRLVLGALARDAEGRPSVRTVDLRRATFPPGASFDRLRFAGEVTFEDAVFEGGASFDHCTFEGTSWFTRTRFTGSVTFDETVFAGAAWFPHTGFAIASFRATRFDADASFPDATFTDRGEIGNARFGADVTFTGVRAGELSFDGVTFAGATSFSGATVAEELAFTGCTFSAARQLGRVHAGRLDLSDSTWSARVEVEAVADRVVALRARFLAGVQLRLGGAEVTLEGADLAAPSLLATLTTDPPVEPPRLVSLSGADVAGLAVSGVDLGRCDLAGAHHLSQLRIERCTFADTPAGWWRAHRQVIAEEVWWRGWQRGPAPELRVEADQVAAVYRDLRKGREDAKDEPGAADFYYGEMEMRRLATGRRHRRAGGRSAAGAAGEHLILTAYWLLSGYGLRAWRALTALAVVVAVSAAAFARWGIEPDARADLATGLLVSARTAAVGLAVPDVALTTFGSWLQLAVRLLGPLLLGLALLAARGRVRR